MDKQITKREIKTSARRLRVLAAFLEKLPRKRFDYARWVGKDWAGASDLSCGTTACALGWATTMPAFRRLGLRLKSMDGLFGPMGVPVVGRNTNADAARIVFLLNSNEADFLFVPREDICARTLDGCHAPTGDATPKQVAAHIRRFVLRHRSVK